MNEQVSALVDRWAHAYLRSDAGTLKDLFLDGCYENRVCNSVSPAAVPENIDLERFIIASPVDKWCDANEGVFEVFFRLDIKMMVGDHLTTCDTNKYHGEVRYCEGQLKMVKLSEVACYPWDLDSFQTRTIETCKLYWEPSMALNEEQYSQLVEQDLIDLRAIYGSSATKDIHIVIFKDPTSLKDFLKAEFVWAEMAGKAKGNHIFIIHGRSIQEIKRLIRHEISHIALDRSFIGESKRMLSPLIDEAIAEAIGRGFDLCEFREYYRGFLVDDDFAVDRLIDLQIENENDYKKKILLAYSLIDYVLESYGANSLLQFVKKITEQAHTGEAISTELAIDLTSFEDQWRQYAID